MPETAIVRKGTPFFTPDWNEKWYFQTWLGAKINRLGKCIAPQYASRYYSEKIIALVAVAADHNPLLPSVNGFDGSILLGCIPSLKHNLHITAIPIKQTGGNSSPIYEADLNSHSLIDNIESSISACSRYFTLHTGDIVLSNKTDGLLIPAYPETRINVEQCDEIILTHKIK